MAKATEDRNPKLIKIPSRTPSLNMCVTFQTRFTTAQAVIQGFAPSDKECKTLPLRCIHNFKFSLSSLCCEIRRNKVVSISI